MNNKQENNKIINSELKLLPIPLEDTPLFFEDTPLFIEDNNNLQELVNDLQQLDSINQFILSNIVKKENILNFDQYI